MEIVKPIEEKDSSIDFYEDTKIEKKQLLRSDLRCMKKKKRETDEDFNSLQLQNTSKYRVLFQRCIHSTDTYFLWTYSLSVRSILQHFYVDP
jgi:hypothetical protein